MAGGCFWERLHYQRMDGVIATCVDTPKAVDRVTYNEVCGWHRAHGSVPNHHDPKKVSYVALCEKLISTIDPTLRDQVGRDYGTQYRRHLHAHRRAV